MSSTERAPVPSCHAAADGPSPAAGSPVVALVGTANVGKSTLFNALTGIRREVGNWPGTTVEVGRGRWRLATGTAPQPGPAEVALWTCPAPAASTRSRRMRR